MIGLASEGESHKDFYDSVADEYDQMIDWEKRTAFETPFFREIISDYKVNSVIDIGCGTGHHCSLCAKLGVGTVVGIDPSAKMLEMAKKIIGGCASTIRLVDASFADVADKVEDRFDLVCAWGNSICHLLTYDDLSQAFLNMRRLVTDSGVILAQLLNWEAPSNRVRFHPLISRKTSEGLKLFFMFSDFHEELVTMNLAIFQKGNHWDSDWSMRTYASTARPWRSEIIRMALDDCGLQLASEFGGTDMSPFDPKKSHDYIFTASKT